MVGKLGSTSKTGTCLAPCARAGEARSAMAVAASNAAMCPLMFCSSPSHHWCASKVRLLRLRHRVFHQMEEFLERVVVLHAHGLDHRPAVHLLPLRRARPWL